MYRDLAAAKSPHAPRFSISLVCVLLLTAGACADREPTVAPVASPRANHMPVVTTPPPVPYTLVDAGTLVHSCGLRQDKTADCWGGRDTMVTAVRGTKLAPGWVIDITAGADHSCAIDTANNAWCWGSDNSRGQMGFGNGFTKIDEPAAVSGGHKFKAITAGESHTCALDLDGAAWCWGIVGQVGNAQAVGDQFAPVAVSGGHTFKSISAGGRHTCGVRTDSHVLCWGENGSGQLGDNSTLSSRTPVFTSTAGHGHTLATINAGHQHTCGVRSDGRAVCWGSNSHGQLGNNSTLSSKVGVFVSTTLTFASASAGGFHSCAVTTSGAAHCWGRNSTGQLGTGSTTSSLTPVAVAGGISFSMISAGLHHSCAVQTPGTYQNAIYCWGSNSHGQVGDGTITTRLVPTQVLHW